MCMTALMWPASCHGTAIRRIFGQMRPRDSHQHRRRDDRMNAITPIASTGCRLCQVLHMHAARRLGPARGAGTGKNRHAAQGTDLRPVDYTALAGTGKQRKRPPLQTKTLFRGIHGRLELDLSGKDNNQAGRSIVALPAIASSYFFRQRETNPVFPFFRETIHKTGVPLALTCRIRCHLPLEQE